MSRWDLLGLPLVAFLVVGTVWAIAKGGRMIVDERQSCRDRGLVPLTYQGRTECVRGEKP